MQEQAGSAAVAGHRAASSQMMEFHSGLRMGFMLSAIAEIGIADQLADGPLSVDILANRTDSNADALYRVLRAMASKGVFTEVSRRTFGLTPLAETLRSGTPHSLRDVFRLQGREIMRNSYAEIGYSIRTGRPAFDHVNGMELFAYMARHPEVNDLFSSAMGNAAGQTQLAAIEAYDLTGARKVIDIGGAHGHLLASILTRYPDIEGVVFDQPHVVTGAEQVLRAAGVLDRAELVGGDYLESVPPGGDVYTISHVLHQVSDAEAVAVLSNVRRVMSQAGRVLVIDPVIPEGDAPHPGKFMDITMMALSRGRDRTGAEFVEVFQKAGLRLATTIGLAAPSSVVVGVPAR